MATYLIKLIPHDTFFFGTGKEFGTDNQNYNLQSGFFPQQTTLLGMLRYQLLCQADDSIFSNNKIKNKAKAGQLIGKHSFTVNRDNNFGAIKRLSPLFLEINGKKYYPLNREYQKENNDWNFREISDNLSLLIEYNVKLGLPEIWHNEDNTILSLKDIFIDHQQVGIHKNYDGESNENSFFLQTFKKFKNKNTSFNFYAEIDTKLKDANVILGRERQTFSMKVKKIENNFNYNSTVFQKSIHAHKIVLIADAFISKELIDECEFAITNLLNFRCLQANIDKTEKYYNIPQKEVNKKAYKSNNLYKSELIQLYSKGSVFYFKDIERLNSFAKKLEGNHPEFYKIGYNHYKIIKKQTS